MSGKKTVHFASMWSPSAAAFSAGAESSFTPAAAGTSPLGASVGSSAASALFHLKHSPPFRTGGRGSKQLSKAIEHSTAEKTSSGTPQELEPIWVIHTRNPIYFAKYVSTNFQDPNSVLVQKMQPSHIDQALLVPWDGHLCIVKSEHLQRIEMKKEPAGWRILETPILNKVITSLREQAGYCPIPPGALCAPSNNKRKYDDWDYVSLESSDFDDSSSKASSSVFQMLGTGGVDASMSMLTSIGGTSESIPLRRKMDVSAISSSVDKPLKSISPADDKVTLTVSAEKIVLENEVPDTSPEKILNSIEPTSLCVQRAPGILKGLQKPSGSGVESPAAESMLFPPNTIDSTESHASANRPPPFSSTSALYRTPSPQNIGRVIAKEPWADDADGFTVVPRLDELSNTAAGIFAEYSCKSVEQCTDEGGDGNDTDTTVEAAEVGMGCDYKKSDCNDVVIRNEDLVSIGCIPLDKSGDVPTNISTAPQVASQIEEGYTTPSSESSILPEENCVNEDIISDVGDSFCTGAVLKPSNNSTVKVKRAKPAKVRLRSSDIPPIPLPRRRATSGTDYANRNSFLGSWPSRKQSAAAGTWNL